MRLPHSRVNAQPVGQEEVFLLAQCYAMGGMVSGQNLTLLDPNGMGYNFLFGCVYKPGRRLVKQPIDAHLNIIHDAGRPAVSAKMRHSGRKPQRAGDKGQTEQALQLIA